MKHIAPVSVVLATLVCLASATRHLTTNVNPDCDLYPVCSQSPNTSQLIHIESTSKTDTYHFLWAFVERFPPALFLLETDSPGGILTVNWTRLLKGEAKAIDLSGPKVIRSFAFEISQLYFANYTTNETLVDLDISQLAWTVDSNQTSGDQVEYRFKTNINNGSISLTFDTYSTMGRAGDVPHLQYTEASTIFRLLAKGVTLPKWIDSAEETTPFLYANFMLVYPSGQMAQLSQDATFDDEYTPGVFERFKYNIKPVKGSNQTAYLDWKPVAYYDTTRVIAKSVAIQSPDFSPSSELPSKSLLNCYYASQARAAYTVQEAARMIFGNPDEDYTYSDNRYVDFSLVLGLGAPPDETLSLVLKIIILGGIGVPMVFFLVSIGYTVWRRVRGTRYDNLDTGVNF